MCTKIKIQNIVKDCINNCLVYFILGGTLKFFLDPLEIILKDTFPFFYKIYVLAMEPTSIGPPFINHMKVTKTKTQYQALPRSWTSLLPRLVTQFCVPKLISICCVVWLPLAQKLVHNIQGNDNMPWSQSTRT